MLGRAQLKIMGSLINFPFSRELTICPPVGASPTDEFEYFVMPDDSLSNSNIRRDDVVVIHRGAVLNSGLHVVRTAAGEMYLGFLVQKDGFVRIETLSDDYEPEIFLPQELIILGRAVQVYPKGNMQERWEFCESPPFTLRKVQAH